MRLGLSGFALIGLSWGIAGVSPAAGADLPAVADAYTKTDSPASNFGSSGALGVSSTRVSLMRFNPTAVAQASGGRALLKLKVTLTKRSTNGVTVHLVQSAWGEKTVTAATLPALSAPLSQKTITSADQGKTISFDVSAALAAWRSNPATNFGLAIVAATPAPNLQLGSREGAAPAVLSIDGSVTADNDVTVGHSGADYASPVDATNNALSGDRWCVSPQLPARPCVMRISSGIYVLRQTLVLPRELRVEGSEKSETVLVAAKGVLAAVSSAAQSISDLSIVNNQDGAASALGLRLASDDDGSDEGRKIERVSVSASGAQANTAVQIAAYEPYALLSDMSIEARGGQSNIGLNSSSSSPRQIVNSTIVATGGSVSNQGIVQTLAQSGRTHLQNSVVTALGGNSAAGLVLGDEESGGAHEIASSVVTAQSSGTAIGVDVHSFGVDLLMLDTEVSAYGGTNGTGVRHSSQGGTHTLDGVRITASSAGLAIGGNGEILNAYLLRSRVIAGQVALRTAGFDAMQITGSLLKAPTWFSGSEDNGRLTIEDSVLDGAADYGQNQLRCTRVYDGNYTLLPSTCPGK